MRSLLTTNLVRVAKENSTLSPDSNNTDHQENVSLGTRLKQTASDLWHQKPGVREKALKKDADLATLSTKQLVDGLSKQEMTFALAATILELALTIIGWHIDQTSKQEIYRRVAESLLIAGLVATGILGLGAFFKRRALLGFGAFLTGMELISFGNIIGIVYLFFGGWLIVRAMKKQRLDRALGKPDTPIDQGFSRRSSKRADTQDLGYQTPSPSKRYTPPRRKVKKPVK